MKPSYYFTLLFLALVAEICCGNEDYISITASDDPAMEEESSKLLPSSKNEDNFVAEKEWKEIKADQPIPAGLHVRINLEKGKKEAKILDKSESVSRQLIATKVKSSNENDVDKEKMNFKINELKRLLKNIKVEELVSNEDAMKVKDKFRNMNDLRKEFAKLDLTIETDAEIMKRLLKQLNNSAGTSDENKVNALLELEYLAHQVMFTENYVIKFFALLHIYYFVILFL